MKKIKILFFGYSSFLKRRVIPSIKKNKKIDYVICSKSKKKDNIENILFNDYLQSLKVFNPDLVYISLINSLHYKYAKLILKKGFHVIVDKPITLSYKKTRELLKIAKKNKLLLAESTLFNYHKVFNSMLNLCKGQKNIQNIKSYFHVPIGYLKHVDCEADMSPYAAAMVRLFTSKKIKNIKVDKEYFKNTKNVKSFKINVNFQNCHYYGSFSRDREYKNQITFFTKNQEVVSPVRVFALPNESVTIKVIKKNIIKKINIKKDDCINNFFEAIIKSLKSKKYNFFYKNILHDSELRQKINLF